jgi:hypothetical protein
MLHLFEYYISIMILTGVFSALHGGNYLGKGYCVGLHVLLVGISSFLFVGNISFLFFIIPVSIWWIFFRNSSQARGELNVIREPIKKNFIELFKSYLIPISSSTFFILMLSQNWKDSLLLLTVLVPILSVYIFNYKSRLGMYFFHKETKAVSKKFHADKIIDNKRIVEFLTGAVPGGIIIAKMNEILVHYDFTSVSKIGIMFL